MCERCEKNGRKRHGQFATMFFPHGSRNAFYVEEPLVQYSRFYAGVILYLLSLDYRAGSDRKEVLADSVGMARLCVSVGARKSNRRLR